MSNIKTRLSRAEAAASSPAHDDDHAAIEEHRRRLIAAFQNGKTGLGEPDPEAEPPDPEAIRRLIAQIVAERAETA